MRKLLCSILIALTLIPLASCVSFSGTASPTSPLVLASVEIGRAIARAKIAEYLRNHHVSQERIDTILGELHEVVDAVIAGNGLGVVVEARWPEVREMLVTRLSEILGKVEVDNLPVFDRVTARALVAAAVDGVAASIRSQLTRGEIAR